MPSNLDRAIASQNLSFPQYFNIYSVHPASDYNLSYDNRYTIYTYLKAKRLVLI